MKHSLISIIISILGSLLICIEANAQSLTFNDKGQLTSTPPGKVNKLADVTIAAGSLNPKPILTVAEQDAFKKELLVIVQRTLNNLDDDSFHLQNYYNQIWGVPANVHTVLRVELTALKAYLKGGPATPAHILAPSTASIVAAFATNPVVAAAAPVNIDDTAVVTVTETDILKSFILQRYAASVVGVNQDMDMPYIVGWRRIEEANRQALAYIDELTTIKSNPLACDPARLGVIAAFQTAESRALSGNNIHTLLNSSPFFKQWLWFTGGFPYINPLSATTPDLIYPENEKNTLLTSLLKKKQDSLQQSGVLKDFVTTGKTINRVLLPINQNGKQDNYLVHYDFLKKYKNNISSLPDAFTNKDSITIITHNVPATLQIKLSIADSIIQNKSDVEIALAAGVSSLGKFITDLTPAAGIWTSLLSKVFNKQNPVIPPRGIGAAGTFVKAYGGVSKKTTFFSRVPSNNGEFGLMKDGITDSVFSSLEEMWTMQKIEKTETAKIEKIRIGVVDVPITYDFLKDKTGILLAYLSKSIDANCVNNCDKEKKSFVEEYLKSVDCYVLNYDNKPKLEADAKKLIDRFECYIANLKACEVVTTTILNNLKDLVINLKPYISIYYRSLPPVTSLTAVTNPEPQRRTIISTVDIGNAELKTAKKTTITLLECKSDAGAEETGKAVAKAKFKFGKLQYFTLSAGLAFTTVPYTVNTINTTTNLPEVIRGERFKLLAALHYYPFGLFSLDNKFATNHLHRASVFVGMGIPKPLENYYGGISYDLVPGIKLMGGYHFFKQTKYSILNNQVVDIISAPAGAGVFLALNFSPETVVNIINIFKK